LFRSGLSVARLSLSWRMTISRYGGAKFAVFAGDPGVHAKPDLNRSELGHETVEELIADPSIVSGDNFNFFARPSGEVSRRCTTCRPSAVLVRDPMPVLKELGYLRHLAIGYSATEFEQPVH